METPDTKEAPTQPPVFLLHREEVNPPLGSSLFYMLACVYVTLLIGAQVATMIGKLRKGAE